MTEYPKAQEGTWTLIAPDGRKWEGPSPLRVCGLEQRERIPADEAMRRIWAAHAECSESDAAEQHD